MEYFILSGGKIMDRQARLYAQGTLQHVVMKGIEKDWIDLVNQMGELAQKRKQQ
jgi:hypothetical protein